MNRMFSWITDKCNPLGGECPYKCSYCWARKMISEFDMKKYHGDTCLLVGELDKRYSHGFVFMQDMTDPFSPKVKRELIIPILDTIKKSPDARFLLLTKNPKRYFEFLPYFSENVVLGCTIETNIDYSKEISSAPPVSERLKVMDDLSNTTLLPLFVCIEPIMNFNPDFAKQIEEINPWRVAVGYDNYMNNLDEPLLNETWDLINRLKKFTNVTEKSIRKAWDE